MKQCGKSVEALILYIPYDSGSRDNNSSSLSPYPRLERVTYPFSEFGDPWSVQAPFDPAGAGHKEVQAENSKLLVGYSSKFRYVRIHEI
jgi:hypothetical protein